MAKGIVFRILVAAVFLSSTSCIHTKPVEHVKMKLVSPTHNQLHIAQDADLVIEHLIYKSSELPLELFTRNLFAGDYKEAIRQINIGYKPSTTDNDLLKELISDGYVPVYLRVTNTGKDNLFVSERDFFVVGNGETTAAIKVDEIPKSFSRFNAAAASANVYNVAVTTVGVLTASYLLIYASNEFVAHGKSPDHNGTWPFPGFGPNDKVINPTSKTTVINYDEFLFKEGVVAPQQTVRGLVFFKVAKPVDVNQLSLAMVKN